MEYIQICDVKSIPFPGLLSDAQAQFSIGQAELSEAEVQFSGIQVQKSRNEIRFSRYQIWFSMNIIPFSRTEDQLSKFGSQFSEIQIGISENKVQYSTSGIGYSRDACQYSATQNHFSWIQKSNFREWRWSFSVFLFRIYFIISILSKVDIHFIILKYLLSCSININYLIKFKSDNISPLNKG